ncbi:MAG: low molecular weight protein-tyrosine-phosphatase [Pollutimonas bauzanensis]|uniref:protein-tyrosine-phosphatase n=1 Tax=Pollutimonas bauzanensis TaxID=658167 RepID=A0A1M5X4G1_9BURK|nr:low molecular weight protein-tyrosine-phosphatase [Pollutimonas bauzanensis]SHH94740.1 protein-tyrosine phosphatase [Pollutimonas bauzanensis]
MNAILVVCVGNICRSPVAEAMLKAQFPGKQIWSAGLSALVGEPADPLAQSIAAEHGLDLSEHRAQQLTSWMCRQADLILVMENGHRQQLEQQHPLARGKIHCLGDLGVEDAFQIADPYRQPRAAFAAAHEAIRRGVSYWADRIRLLS